MNDLVGKCFISNNISVYDNEMLQFVYTCKFANRNKLSKEDELQFPDLTKDFYKIKLVCNSEFERGSILRIISINEKSRNIYVEKLDDYQGTHRLPVLVFLIQTIGVDADAQYEFIESPGVKIILLSEDIYRGSKFYGVAALTNDPKSFIRGRDRVSGAEFEWVLEYSQSFLNATSELQKLNK